MTQNKLSTRFPGLAPFTRRLTRADPLLMGAAVSYKAFFAFVPLAVALVGVLGALGTDPARLESLKSTGYHFLPSEAAALLDSVIDQASDLVGQQSALYVFGGLAIALWAGSSGLYALQKSLRYMTGVEENRRYWVVRGIGMAFTVFAGISLAAGYLVVLFGDAVAAYMSAELGISVGLVDWSLVVVTLWIFVELWVIYRWGPPRPIIGAAPAAFVSAVLLVGGTAVATWLVSFVGESTAAAILGNMAVVLVWLYYMAAAVISVAALFDAYWTEAWTWVTRRTTGRARPS